MAYAVLVGLGLWYLVAAIT